jgi:glutamate dehydrogenase
VAAIHFGLGTRLHIHWLRARIDELERDDRWKVLARAALREDLNNLHRALTAAVLRTAPEGADPAATISAWMANNPAAERCLVTLSDIQLGGVYDLTTLGVGVRVIRNLL